MFHCKRILRPVKLCRNTKRFSSVILKIPFICTVFIPIGLKQLIVRSLCAVFLATNALFLAFYTASPRRRVFIQIMLREVGV